MWDPNKHSGRITSRVFVFGFFIERLCVVVLHLLRLFLDCQKVGHFPVTLVAFFFVLKSIKNELRYRFCLSQFSFVSPHFSILNSFDNFAVVCVCSL